MFQFAYVSIVESYWNGNANVGMVHLALLTDESKSKRPLASCMQAGACSCTGKAAFSRLSAAGGVR